MHPRTAVALLSAILTTGCLTGCIVPPHDSFATPQDTVLTFQSAFARDDEFREYDCFSNEMRDAQGLSQQKWSTARGLVFEPFGAIGRFVLRRNSLADNLLGGAIGRGDARLVYGLFGRRLEVELVPEAVLLLPNPITGKVDAWTLSEKESHSTENTGFTAARLITTINVSRELAARYETDGVAWAELRNQWKVNAIAASDETAAAPPPLTPPQPEKKKTVIVGRLRPQRLRESLGVVKLLFTLPLGNDSDCAHVDPQDLLPDRAYDCFRWESETAPSR